MRDLFRYRDLILTLVARDLKVRYRRSVIGFLWTMLEPLLTMLVLTVVFSAVFRFDIQNYPIYVLAGLLFWNFFRQSVMASMNSLRTNARLIQRLPVRREVFPVAAVLSGGANLLLALVPLLGILIATGHDLEPALAFLPVAVALALLFTLGAGLLLAPLAVFFIDIVETVGVLLTVLLYLTPVFYPMAIVPENLRWLVRYNPVRSVLELFRGPIYEGRLPSWTHVAVATALAFGALVVGALVFRGTSQRIALYV